MTIENECNGSGPHSTNNKGEYEVRVLPLGAGGNLILCYTCCQRELRWREQRNRELAEFAKFALPTWESLEVYAHA
jgi:hypothetical protein